MIQFIDSQKSNKSDQGNGSGDVQSRDVIKYADVKIQEVTFFLRCSKCPEMTLFRLDDLSVDRKRNQVKARDPRTTLSADEPIKIGPVKSLTQNRSIQVRTSKDRSIVRGSLIKAILNGLGVGKVQFIGSRISCLPSEKLDEKLFHMNSMIINVETVKQKVEIKISDDPIQEGFQIDAC